jgi:2'-5' RNA ligase
MIAINILIEPDAATTEKARAVNARLQQDYPPGFALDASHVPHITLLQRFVRVRELDAVAAAVAKALQSGPALPLELTVTGYDSSVRNDVGTLIWVVERTAEIHHLAKSMEAAVRPFVVSGGTAEAFSKQPGEEISDETIRYVEEFVPSSSGQNYFPHLTLGKARAEFLESLESPPFERFSFAGENVAIYQLGNAGTAQKELY